MKKYFVILLMLCSLPAFAQADKRDVRAGNRRFGRGQFKESEIDYRKAVLKDSTSVTANYDLASALYRQEDWAGAAKALESVKEQPGLPAQYYYNAGDAALQQQDYQAAVNAFRQALLLDPGDLDAKENYIYAKKMLQNQQQGGGGNDNRQDQNQDQQKDQQNQDQNQDQQNQDQQDQNQDQNQNQDQQQDQDQNRNQQQQEQQQPQISPQQAQQMLRAIQAKEKETQDKVNKEKAALLKSREKEKNW